MRFTEVETEAVKPPAFALVPASAFDSRWEERPTSTVAIGLRLIPIDDVKTARATAAKAANDAHPNVDPDDPVNWPLWVECYNDALMLWVVARGICDPADATSSWKPFEPAPEDMARDYLTPGGVRYLYDEWERMRIATDPTSPEITDDEIEGLPDLLAEKLPLAGRIRAARVKRLLAFVVRELEELDVPTPTKG